MEKLKMYTVIFEGFERHGRADIIATSEAQASEIYYAVMEKEGFVRDENHPDFHPNNPTGKIIRILDRPLSQGLVSLDMGGEIARQYV